MHLGNYESLQTQLYTQAQDKCEFFTDTNLMQQVVFNATLAIANLEIVISTPLTCWKTASNFVIPKKKEVTDLTHISNICIYKFDLNAILALKLNEAIHALKEVGIITNNQQGELQVHVFSDPP